MSLKSICKAIAQERNIHPDSVYDIAREVFDRIESAAIASGHCVVRPFGTFRMVRTSARTARNPRTNDPIPLPPRNKLTFAHGKGRRTRLMSQDVGDQAEANTSSGAATNCGHDNEAP